MSWLGRLVLKWRVVFKSLGVFFPIFLFQGQDSLSAIKWCSFLCFVVSKLWEKGWGTSAILPDWQLWVVSLKMGKESPLPHNSSFSSSAQMQAARWLFIKGRQPKVHTVLNTVSARESQATSTLETKPKLRLRSEQIEWRHHRNFASQRYLLAPQVS